MRSVDPEILLALHPWVARRVRWSDLLRFCRGTRFLLLFAIIVIAFSTFDPKAMLGQVGLPVNLAVWLGAGIVYMAAMMGQVWLVGYAFGTRLLALVPLLGMVAALLGTWALWTGYAVATGGPMPGLWPVLRDTPVNFMWVMLFETLGHVFVLPDAPGLRQERAAEAPAAGGTGGTEGAEALPDALAPERVLIGAREVARADIRTLRADGHFLQVATKRERFTTRARLRDVAAQIAHARGFQPHRSWWVAVEAITCMEVEGPVVRLCLEDGEKVNVARSRMAAFREIEPEIHAALRARQRAAGKMRRMRMPLVPALKPARLQKRRRGRAG